MFCEIMKFFFFFFGFQFDEWLVGKLTPQKLTSGVAMERSEKKNIRTVVIRTPLPLTNFFPLSRFSSREETFNTRNARWLLLPMHNIATKNLCLANWQVNTHASQYCDATSFVTYFYHFSSVRSRNKRHGPKSRDFWLSATSKISQFHPGFLKLWWMFNEANRTKGWPSTHCRELLIGFATAAMQMLWKLLANAWPSLPEHRASVQLKPWSQCTSLMRLVGNVFFLQQFAFFSPVNGENVKQARDRKWMKGPTILLPSIFSIQL